MEIENVKFTLDQYGYIHPMRPKQDIISKFKLKPGNNLIRFELDFSHSISCQIYLFSEHEKILVSDMDGTLTKDDVGGLYNNFNG